MYVREIKSRYGETVLRTRAIRAREWKAETEGALRNGKVRIGCGLPTERAEAVETLERQHSPRAVGVRRGNHCGKGRDRSENCDTEKSGKATSVVQTIFSGDGGTNGRGAASELISYLGGDRSSVRGFDTKWNKTIPEERFVESEPGMGCDLTAPRSTRPRASLTKIREIEMRIEF